MPGDFGGIVQLWTMLLTAAVGIAVGLLVSAIVKTSEMATSLVPLILIPQILFSGLVGVPTGIPSKIIGLTMPVTWSFDTMKRYSTLDTLEPEGAYPNGKTKGLGLYEFVRAENQKIADETKADFEKFKTDAQTKMIQGVTPNPEDFPKTRQPENIPKDLSNYVTFFTS